MDNITMLDNEQKSHFMNLYAMALTDTQIDTIELEMLFKMGEDRGIPKEEIQKLILFPDQVKFSIPSDTLVKMEYLYDFARMAWANGEIDKYEEIALIKFCNKFGFEEANAPKIAQFLIEEAKKGTDKQSLLELVKQNL
jgi:hypothetical protein